MNQLRFLINPYFAVLFDPRECGVQVSKDVQNEVDESSWWTLFICKSKWCTSKKQTSWKVLQDFVWKA